MTRETRVTKATRVIPATMEKTVLVPTKFGKPMLSLQLRKEAL